MEYGGWCEEKKAAGFIIPIPTQKINIKKNQPEQKINNLFK